MFGLTEEREHSLSPRLLRCILPEATEEFHDQLGYSPRMLPKSGGKGQMVDSQSRSATNKEETFPLEW